MLGFTETGDGPASESSMRSGLLGGTRLECLVLGNRWWWCSSRLWCPREWLLEVGPASLTT